MALAVSTIRVKVIFVFTVNCMKFTHKRQKNRKRQRYQKIRKCIILTDLGGKYMSMPVHVRYIISVILHLSLTLPRGDNCCICCTLNIYMCILQLCVNKILLSMQTVQLNYTTSACPMLDDAQRSYYYNILDRKLFSMSNSFATVKIKPHILLHYNTKKYVFHQMVLCSKSQSLGSQQLNSSNDMYLLQTNLDHYSLSLCISLV